jgi:low temperature requirement protein LtrA
MSRILPGWFVEPIEPTPDEEDLRVSTLELFFDLIFVFIVTQFAGLIAHDPALGLLQAVLMLGFLWWMYAGFGWLTNVIPPTRPARRILMICAMGGWLLVGLSVPEAFEHGTVWIAVGMLVVVLVHGLMYLQAARTFGSIFVANLAAVAVVFFAQLVSDGWPRYALWAVAVGVVWMVPVVHNQKGFNLHPAHIVERHGLVAIVALGESVVAIGVGARSVPLDVDLLLAALLGLVVAAGMWWALFVDELSRVEAVLTAERNAVSRVRRVLNGFFYAFVPLLLGILVTAAGIEHAIGHATDALHWDAALLLSGGVALYLLGTAGLRAAMSLPGALLRLGAAVLTLALTPLGRVNAAAEIAALAVALVAGLALEARQKRLAQSPEPPPLNQLQDVS